MSGSRLIAVGGIALLALASSAFADTYVAGPTGNDLGRALSQARSGDRVILTKGLYGGGTFQVAAGVRIIARGARLEGELTLVGDQLSVRNLRLTDVARLEIVGDGADVRGMRAPAERSDRPALSILGDDASIRRSRFGPNGPGAGWAVSIQGNDASVTRSKFRFGARMIAVVGSGADVNRNVMKGVGSGVEITGTGFDVSDNRIQVGVTPAQRGGPAGDVGAIPACPAVTVYEGSSDGVIADNDVRNPVGGSAFVVEASNTSITGNTARGVDTADVTILVTGDTNVVTDNVIRDFGEAGVVVVGDGVDVSRNVVTQGAGTGVQVRGDGGVVLDNTISQSGRHGVYVRGDDVEVCRNTVDNPFDMGVLVLGSDSLVEENEVDGAFGDAILVDGDRNDVKGNAIPSSYGDGVVIYGSENVLTSNVVTETRRAGICIVGGSDNAVSDCSATDCVGLGFDNRGTMTDLTGSTFLRNALDLHNEGTFDLFSNNRIGTGLE